jgi:hypothetical protein
MMQPDDVSGEDYGRIRLVVASELYALENHIEGERGFLSKGVIYHTINCIIRRFREERLLVDRRVAQLEARILELESNSLGQLFKLAPREVVPVSRLASEEVVKIGFM